MKTAGKILITGGEGNLGQAFKRHCADFFPGSEVSCMGRSALDVANRAMVMRVGAEIRPDLIIHCAALVNAELCEVQPAQAERDILTGTRNMVDLAKMLSARFFFPQSFLVYDGAELPITESTVPNPTFHYGRLKFEAEKYITENLSDHMVVIMGGFFGSRERDKNFVGKIIPVILQHIKKSKTVIEIGDRIWQPTLTDDLARNSLLLLTKGKKRRYLMASQGEASFAELTLEIIEILELRHLITVKPVSAAAVAHKEKARRPHRAVLSNAAMEAEGLFLMRDWRVALREYLTTPYFKNMITKELEGANL